MDTILDIVSFNALTLKSALTVSRVCKQAKLIIDDNEKIIVEREFVNTGFDVLKPLFDKYEIYTIGESIKDKKEFLMAIQWMDFRMTLLENFAKIIHRVTDLDDIKTLCRFVNLKSYAETTRLYQVLTSYMLGLVFKSKPQKGYRIIKMYIELLRDHAEQLIAIGIENFPKPQPAILDELYLKAIIAKCEYMIENAQISTDPEVNKIQFKDHLLFFRDVFSRVEKSKGIFYGPRGGRYMMVNGKKKYIR